MKNICVFAYLRTLLFGLVICVGSFCLGGCASPGETASEVNRRHRRVLNHAYVHIQDDVDALFLIDRPHRLGDKVSR